MKTLLRVVGVIVAVALPAGRIAMEPVAVAAEGTVRVEGGLISGAVDRSPDVRVFKGIPFAAPPVGELRWRPPAPVHSWEGVRKADQYAAPCLQNALPGLPGASQVEFTESLRLPGPPSEDCLSLNIWTAAKSGGERRPVMVWIHGGGMVIGTPAVPITEGGALAKKGVVVVSINYRLGIFGFLAHPDLTRESAHHSSGNYALLDQIAALQWVQKNIAAFGGDPKNVTIFGESAGSWSVNLLVASPLGKGLFHRAIGESGALLVGVRQLGDGVSVHAATLSETERAGVALAQKMGAASIGDLRAKPAADLLKLSSSPLNPIGTTVGVSIDGWVVPESLDVIFAKGRQNDVPILIGSNATEGALFVSSPVRADAAREQAARAYGAQVDGFLKLYPAATDEEARMSTVSYLGDSLFALQMRTWARLQRQHAKSPAYLYWFGRVPPDAQCRCATHASEIVYAFDNVALSARPFQDTDRKVADVMSSYWVNFAAKGDPNGAGLPSWPAYSESSDTLMAIGDTIAAGPVPRKAQLDFLETHFRDARPTGHR